MELAAATNGDVACAVTPDGVLDAVAGWFEAQPKSNTVTKNRRMILETFFSTIVWATFADYLNLFFFFWGGCGLATLSGTFCKNPNRIVRSTSCS